MEYTVLCLGNLKQLTQSVQDYILQGWEPLGGITGTPDPRKIDKENPIERRFGTLWAQALIMRDK